MKRITVILFVFLSLAASAQSFVAGGAKVDITPSVSDLQRPSDVIRGKLHVRLQPGHAEKGIVEAAKRLMKEAR
jgi:hypothetical protein